MNDYDASPPRWGKVKIHYDWFWPDRRCMDRLNAAQCLKPAIDGFVDAGIMVDDDWETVPLPTDDYDFDKHNPRVEITITEDTA